jgi:hypothetical protein
MSSLRKRLSDEPPCNKDSEVRCAMMPSHQDSTEYSQHLCDTL